MNMDRGFSVPNEKREVWAPVTPGKPVKQGPNHVDVGMQNNQIGGENWQDLLGFCADVLQDESCVLPPSWNKDSHEDVNQGEPIIKNSASVALLTTVDQNSRPTGVVGLHNVSAGQVDLNHWSQDLQDVAPIDKFRSFDQTAKNASSYLQNVGDVVLPQKVSSLAELLGMSTSNAPTTSGDGISSASENPSSISQHYHQTERNWNSCIPDSMNPQQNHSFHANQDIGGYNLQQMPNSRLSVSYRPSYNLRLPLRSEAEESSSVATPFHLGPITPDQHKLKNNQISQTPNLSIDEISSKEDNRQDFMLPPQADIEGREHNDFVSDTQSTASLNNSTKGKQNLLGRNDGEFDLNKTPTQKAPKRKKHRPKVVVEGKPRRTPKSAAKENKNPTPTKRKYVRKKGIETPKNQFVHAENGVTNSEPQGKTCKRSLNFELETRGKKIKCKEVDNQADNNQGSNAPRNLDLNFHIAGLDRKSTCPVETVRQNLCREKKQTESTYNFIPSTEKISPQESLQPAAIISSTTLKDHTLNIIARSLNVRNTNTNQCGVQDTYGGGGLSQLVLLANASQQDLARLEHPRLQSTQLLGNLEDIREKQERKRLYSHIEMTQPLMVSQICPRGASATGNFKKESVRPWLNVSSSSNINGISTGNRYAADFPEQSGSPGNKGLHAQAYKLLINGGLPYFGGEERSTLMNPAYKTHKLPHHWYMDSNSSGLKFQRQMADTKSHPLAEKQTNCSFTAVANGHLLSAFRREPEVIIRNATTDAPAHLTTKRQYTRRTPPKKMSSTDIVLQQETRNLQGYGHDLKTVSGSQRYKRNICPVDDITYRMKNLQIRNSSHGNVEEEHNALVPYTGYGAVVPYEDPIKKRQPRPKVDLDPETNRLWNLLMGSNEGNDNAETMDKNKQKWWEEERRVFRGRVDSFIARMHLVQGDRRFSKWKGSVVDSVIGVFLTQNVSDHLSSSAFMSLAAKFPNKSTTTRDTSCQKAGNPSAEYVVEVRHPDGTTCHERMTREPVYDNTVKSSKLSEYGVENVTSGTFSLNKHTRRMEEGTVSSQSSSESMSFLASEDIRSSSGSNSEVEDQVTGSNYRENQGPLYLFKETGGFTEFQNNRIQETGFSLPVNRPLKDNQQYENQVNMRYPGVARSTNECTYPLTINVQHYQRPAPIPKGSWQDMLMGTGNMENDVSAFLEKECTSSLTSTLCDTTSRTVTEVLHDKAGESMDHRPMGLQTGGSAFQISTVYHKVPTKHLETEVKFPNESDSKKNQHYEHRGMQEIFQQERNFVIDPVKSAEALRQNPTDSEKPYEKDTTKTTVNTQHQLDSDEQSTKKVHDSDVQSSKISTTSTAREQKAEKEKVQSFDWDTLRKQVQKGDTRERSRDTLDSLDYESIRNADVHEIANSIKERGMNNMLAARMKDFLNRLVKDHGSIDLEWLRDAPPDKVKDYLLSIRGLGLKSVECVRLLTLHHLAFPVDTNVGRIAVRLGWVPLQPLPESLQLHLLEMYPMLESIQKYLWPRLCMLDQETLYELHYQLITFGKVFCTKRQPNCNGCPMRGECRHFASAFASARLTLPGPEERRIVCSEVPTSYSKSHDVVTRPMPLPPPEDKLGSGPGLTRNCEPIVEEPTTPESTEVTERDIEDAFYEDPDEIPEIKLNIEEFTTNLQSFMQDNKDIHDGDMSKAIIALSPRLASIPTPKLKNVSRLRTEHQVYELPDSHPLLQGMDRREPDDPSPYLLALWTPGETADSIQPPDGKCSSSEGGLCEKKTCFQCNSTKEEQAQSVRGTILIPCRTAMRGSFPLNGTYFQVNEVFADHESSTNPIHVPRRLIWNLPRRTVFFGTSVSTIFKGMSTEGIQYCFWKGFVCVRGFDQKTRAPRPLKARLHLPASKIPKQKE